MNPISRLRLRWRVRRDSRASPAERERRRRRRLSELVDFARDQSPFYRELYSDVPQESVSLDDLPPVRKPQLMARFDDWVTDPEVRKEDVLEFISDPSNLGQHYLGRYAAWRTSGTSGEPGVFMHDHRALYLYDLVRSARSSGSQFSSILPSRARTATIRATGGHYTSESRTERERRRSPLHARRLKMFSVMQPLPELVEKLNEYQPHIIAGYPSALRLLAEEQRAGRLRIDPNTAVCAGEVLSPGIRDTVVTTFDCSIRNLYASSEFPPIATECPEGRLHANTDWMIFEPVDEDYEPVAPGETSETVLLTNLANRIQPLIRYDLGDSVRVVPEECPCGSSFPVIEVEGRQDDILRFEGEDGEEVSVLPLAIESVVDTVPDVRRFQLIQTGPRTLRVRLDVTADAGASTVWQEVTGNLREYLAEQGLADVTVEQSSKSPQRDEAGGKFRRVRSRCRRTPPARSGR